MGVQGCAGNGLFQPQTLFPLYTLIFIELWGRLPSSRRACVRACLRGCVRACGIACLHVPSVSTAEERKGHPFLAQRIRVLKTIVLAKQENVSDRNSLISVEHRAPPPYVP